MRMFAGVLLGKERESTTREVSRDYWLDNQDGLMAGVIGVNESNIRTRLLNSGRFGSSIIGALLLKFAVALAIELIKYWIENNIKNPSPGGFQSGEPRA